MRIVSFGYGVAVASVATSVILSIALIFQFTEGAAFWLFVAASLAGCVAPWLRPNANHMGEQVLGAGLVSVGGLVIGISTTLGWAELSGVLGGVVAIDAINRRWITRLRWPEARFLLFASMALAIYVLLPLIINGQTFGHDESAYALKARSWLDGTPSTGWSLHRGVGMSVYAMPILAWGGGEAGLRLLGLAGTLGMISAVYVLAQRMASPRVAGFSAAAVLGIAAILRRGTEYLSDIPSAALLVGVMVIIWREFQRHDGPSYRLIWITPSALVAFYLRYQSILSLGLVAITTAVLWWPRIKRRPGPAIATVAVSVLGFIPHAVHAIGATGSPLGILLNTGQGAVREFVGQGFFDYASLVLSGAGGFVWPVTTLALALGTYYARNKGEERQRYLFLFLPVFGQILALGLISHGEVRFVFFPVALAIVGGLMAIEQWIGRQPLEKLRLAALIGLGVLFAGSVGMAAAGARTSVEGRILSNEPVQLASEVVAADDCGVLTSYLPQVTYYSQCHTEPFRLSRSAEAQVDGLIGRDRFMILVDDGKRQPQGENLNELISLADGLPTRVAGQRGGASVYEFPEP